VSGGHVGGVTLPLKSQIVEVVRMTHMLTLLPYITTVWTPAVLAVINII